MKVLVIEDDPTVGQFVKRGLEEHRWSVDLIADGETGERLAPHHVIGALLGLAGTVLLASVTLMQLVGPVAARFAFTYANEADPNT